MTEKISLRTGAVVMVGIVAFAVYGIAFAATTNMLLPQSDGNYVQWTPSAGVTHYTLVDETACNGTTDYNRTTTVGQRDSYGVSVATIPDGATITSVAIKPCASRNSTGGGSATLNVFYRFSGINSADAGAYALPTGTTPLELATTTYSSLAHVKVATSTLEIGAIYTSGTKGIRLSRIKTQITYTPPLPTVTTNTASSITASGATLNGTANPNGGSTTGWFRYASSSPGTCDDSFGVRAPSGGGTALGSGTSSVPYLRAITGLTENTTYYFCAIASSTSGTAFGSLLSFTTITLPSVTTNAASTIGTSTATLNGEANPNGFSALGWFRYATTSPGTCSDAFGIRAPSLGGTALGAGSSSVAYLRAITGLTASTTYHYCAIASSTAGTAFGALTSFSTLP